MEGYSPVPPPKEAANFSRDSSPGDLEGLEGSESSFTAKSLGVSLVSGSFQVNHGQFCLVLAKGGVDMMVDD